jgi:hypothetical protein
MAPPPPFTQQVPYMIVKPCKSWPRIPTSLVWALTVPTLAIHLSTVLTSIRAKAPSAFALAIFRAAFDAVPNAFHLIVFSTGISGLV